jgi:fibronectin type 3 domain-containing protein
LTAQKTVAALGHNYSKKVTKATYTAKSYTTYTCLSCGNSYKSNDTNMLTLTKPTVKVANTSNGVKVTWSKTTGATGYIVYRKTGSGKWTTLKTITSGSTVSYLDKTAKAGTTYYYTVRAYAGSTTTNKSSYVTDVSIKYLAQPTVTLTNTSTGVKISWTKSTGAGGYYVYRKAPGDKKWTLINKASNLSYIDTTAKAGTTYYYTVKAYSGKTYSSYVTDKTIKRLTQPVVTLSKVSSGVKVAWQKITGASGYYVYRKASGAKSWTLLKKITSGSTVSYTDTKAKSGTTYYYTVKAYSGNINSSYVTNKSIKYKK